MASVLDLRRRIRSVKSTRQITRAMKMVSAAVCAARRPGRWRRRGPTAQMITQRAGVADSPHRDHRPHDGESAPPRSLRRGRRRRFCSIVVSGDRGFAGAFNSNILKAGFQFLNGNGDKEIDVESVGRKATDTFRRRYPAAVYSEKQVENPADGRQITERVRERKGGYRSRRRSSRACGKN